MGIDRKEFKNLFMFALSGMIIDYTKFDSIIEQFSPSSSTASQRLGWHVC